jgi:hypothetical protein
VEWKMMFFHPEKALKNIYSDPMSFSRFSNIFFKVFGTTLVVAGLWAAYTAVCAWESMGQI